MFLQDKGGIKKFIASPIDRVLNKKSRNAIENGAVAEAIERIEADIARLEGLKASLTNSGFVQLSSATDVTDSTGIALPVTEKNASVEGTLANEIKKVANEMFKEHEPPTDLNTIRGSGIYTIYNTTVNAPVNYGILLMFDTVSYAMQILKSSVTSAPQLFLRTRGNQADNNWSDWISYKPT